MSRHQHKPKPIPRVLDSRASDGFINVAAKLGTQAQNINRGATYVDNSYITRDRNVLENMYRGSWIVGAAIDSVAEDMTRAGINITGSNEPKDIEKMQGALSKLGVWGGVLDLIKWGRLYGGAIGLLVIDGQDTATPLRLETISKNQFKGIKVYDRHQLTPDLNDLIVGGMDDGLPKYYTVMSNGGTLRLHHSRCIRMVGIQLPYWQAIREELWGESIIERLYDRLIGFDTATTGAMNLIHKAHLRTMRIDGLRSVLAAGGKPEESLINMFTYMSMLQNSSGITLLDKDDEFSTQSYSFGGISEMILQFGQQLSGALGIPLVRLFGQSPAGLNSSGESDLRTYYDNIKAQQESRLREAFDRVLKVLHRSLFATDAPENLNFEFAPLWQTSSKEKVEISEATTRTVVQAYEAGLIDKPTAMQELRASAEHTGIYTNIQQDDIEEAQAEPPSLPVENETQQV